MTDANLYICLNCKHKMRRSSFYEGAVNEPCDACGQVHIERYDALQEFVRAARRDELRRLDDTDDSDILLTDAGLRYLMARSAALSSNQKEETE